MTSGIIGTYVVALRLPATRIVAIGRRGPTEFPRGWYLYVGSAMGPGGLGARLSRHRRQRWAGKRLHWHIDYLRDYARWEGAWTSTHGQRQECTWASNLLRLPCARIVMPGFGASDCDCSSHLVHVPELPDDDWFSSILGASRSVVLIDRLDELLEMLSTGDEDARERAAEALGPFGSEAVRRLEAMLNHGETELRWWSARALAEIGGDRAVQLLAGALADSDPDVRACAALALGRIRSGLGTPALAASLRDESAFVAGVAADALNMVGESAIPELETMLANPNTHARLLAVRVLSRIQSPRAIGPLFRALEDSSYLVRYHAREGLEALGAAVVLLSP